MKKALFILLFSVTYIACSANSLDSLLNVLDTTIVNKQRYADLRRSRIETLKQRYRAASSPEDKTALANDITLQYIVFRTDSALHYVNLMAGHAREAGNPFRLAESGTNRARTLRVMGLYKEAWDLLDTLAVNLPARKVPDYLDARLSVANAMRDYATEENMKQRYALLAEQYRDSLLKWTTMPPMSRIFVTAEDLILDQRYDEALDILMEKYKELKPNSRNAGVIAYSIAAAFSGKGDRDKETEYFTRSALSDIRAGVKDYTSLRRLAALMFEKGDIDRAYNYMKCSLEDALFCNARLMTIEASDMFLVIDQSYQQKEKLRKQMMRSFLALTGILSLLMLTMLLVIIRQNQRLKRTRDELSASNRKLDSSNRKLSDSNRIKEEYIGLYMEQYSDHLSEMTSLKNKVHKHARSGGDVKSLVSVVDSSVKVDDELKNFYSNFDATILHLFPDFPSQFDELLVPEARGIYSKTEGGLTPALRIFALIRLGIVDSMKIAQFLRYSASTIYNYRTKLRNKALGERDAFESKVMKLGTSSDPNRK